MGIPLFALDGTSVFIVVQHCYYLGDDDNSFYQLLILLIESRSYPLRLLFSIDLTKDVGFNLSSSEVYETFLKAKKSKFWRSQ